MNFKELFKNHNDWECSEYTVTNKKTGLTLWTGNGMFFFGGYGNNSISFSILEKFMGYKELNKMLKRKLLGLNE